MSSSIPGLTLVAKRGTDHMAHIGARGGRSSMSVYGDSKAARSIRAADLRKRRGMTDRQWTTLLRRREQSFGLTPGTLTPVREVPMSRG